MSQIETSQAARVLRDDELDAVTGGIIVIGGKPATSPFVNPLDIHGFNPQPDPPAMPAGH